MPKHPLLALLGENLHALPLRTVHMLESLLPIRIFWAPEIFDKSYGLKAAGTWLLLLARVLCPWYSHAIESMMHAGRYLGPGDHHVRLAGWPLSFQGWIDALS